MPDSAMPMKLIGPWLSGYTRRVGISLKILDIAFEHIPLNAYLDKDAVRRFSPMGKVPALVLSDGEILFDSGSIIDYLDELVGPERALLPQSGPSRRSAQKLVGIGSAIYGKLSGLFDEALRPVRYQLEAVSAALTEQALIGFAMLEEEVGTGWMVDGRLGQADIMAVICYQSAAIFVLPDVVTPASFPRLAGLANRAMEIVAFAATLPEV